MDEATVYDDGYNRKKSRKRKKKNAEKDKSRPKKDSNKSITDDVVVKTELKVEVDDGMNLYPEQSSLEDGDQEGSGMIISSDNIAESVKTEEGSEFSEVFEKPVKKKKKHSKSGESKKSKAKSASKKKNKHLNVSIFDMNEPLDVSDADVQRKLMAMPSLSHHKSSPAQDLSSSQASNLSENIIFSSNEISILPVKEKGIVHVISSANVANTSYYGTRGTERLMETSIANARANLHTKSNKKANISALKSTFSKQAALKTMSALDQAKPVKIDKAVESEYIVDNGKVMIPEGKSSSSTSCKSVGTMLTERSILNYSKKDIIKAPRLSLLKSAYVPATEVSTKLDPEKSIEEEKDTRASSNSIVVLPKTWSIAKPQDHTLANTGIMFLNSGFSNPPILQKENPVQEPASDARTLEHSKPANPCAIQIPRLESIFAKNSVLGQSLAQSVTCHNVSGTSTDVKTLGKRSTTDTSKMMATKFWQLPVSNNNSSLFYSKDASVDDAIPDTSLTLSTSPSSSSLLNSKFLLAPASKCTSVSMYPQPSMTVDFSKKCLQSSTSARNVASPSYVKVMPKAQDHVLLRRALSQKGETCSRLPVKNAAAVGSVKTASIQADPLEIGPSNKGLNVAGFDIGAQSSVNHIVPGLQTSQKLAAPALQQEQLLTVSGPADKLQTHTVQNTSDSIYTSMPALMPIKITTSRRKSKEKVKKATTRKKDPLESKMTKTTVINLDDSEVTSSLMDKPPSVSHRVSMIPGHISDMLYPSVPNNDLLKAFNDYWSAQISHCAVCAPFTSSCNGHGRLMPPDWKYCKPTVLPEGSPIWVSLFPVPLIIHNISSDSSLRSFAPRCLLVYSLQIRKSKWSSQIMISCYGAESVT